jgi:hypothetical protein
MIQNKYPLALLLLSLSLPAFAAKTKAQAMPAPSEDTTFSVAVPKSDLALPPLERSDDAAFEKSWSIGASSWVPADFKRFTYDGSSSSFKRGALPYVFAEVGAPLWRPGGLISARFGIGYGTLERSGPAAAGGQNASPKEELRLLQLRIGAEYENAGLGELVYPYAGFAFLPTFGMASKSQFEDRVSTFGLPMEASAGVRIRPRFLREFWSFRNGALGLGGHYVFGTMDGSSLRGLGAQGYLQVSL